MVAATFLEKKTMTLTLWCAIVLDMEKNIYLYGDSHKIYTVELKDQRDLLFKFQIVEYLCFWGQT